MKDLSNLPENYISWNESVDRVGGEEDFLIELLNDLKDLVQQNLDKIKQFIDENNYTKIRELAHSMKGASGNLGLNIMYDTTLNLENNAIYMEEWTPETLKNALKKSQSLNIDSDITIQKLRPMAWEPRFIKVAKIALDISQESNGMEYL